MVSMRQFLKALATGAAFAICASASQAATITDAYFNLDGTYLGNDSSFSFGGTFDGEITGDPSAKRPYKLGISAYFDQYTLNETVDIAGIVGSDFSIEEASEHALFLLESLIAPYTTGDLLDAIDPYVTVSTLTPTAIAGTFGGTLPYSMGEVEETVCGFVSIFSGSCALPDEAGFGFELALFYETEMAPVPLPAGLPLLAGGLAALAMLRRRRAA